MFPSHILVLARVCVLRFLQLVTAAKQALLHHSFSNARQLLTEAIAIHPSFKVSKPMNNAEELQIQLHPRQRKTQPTSSSWC